MAKRREIKTNFTKDIGSVVLSITVAIVLAKTGALKDLLLASQEREILGAFLAGMCFTSLLTVAPAAVALAELAAVQPLWQLALFGAIGALLADFLLFEFLKDHISDHVNNFFQRKRKKILPLFRLSSWRWIVFVMGAIVIASPLPDELGLAMMGLKKMKPAVFVAVFFVLDFLGILILGLAAREVL